MRRIMIFGFILASGLFLSVHLSFGQITKIVPEKPIWGETIILTYDPSAEAAAFLPGDEVYAVCFISQEDSVAQSWKKLRREDDLLTCEIKVEEGMSYLTFYFITKETWDRKAAASTMIWKKAGMPAQGAYQQKMLSSPPEEYLEYFQKERETYPKNYAVFRDKWFLAGAFDQKNQVSMIKQDMAALEKEKSDSPSFLYALSYGYMVLENEPAGRKILKHMKEQYPLSFYTGIAISSYDYMVFSQQLKGEGPEEVSRLKLELLKIAPLTFFARNNCEYFTSQKNIELETIHAVCDPWIKEEPDNPIPYYALARACLEKKIHLEKAAKLIDQAIQLTLLGKLRLYKDVSGALTERYLPRYFMLSSDIQFQTGNFSRALADIKTAQALLKEARPDYYQAEAKIWQEIGHFQKAEQALLSAHRLGSQEAVDSLKELFRKRRASLEGFDVYFAEAQAKHASTGTEKKPTAPPFKVETLDGDILELSELKGKIIVLNFWFIGCAPCRVEMPGLNKLTQEYQDKDVVFIAFAMDEAPALKEFLQKKSFKYQIVARGGKIAASYGVNVYPTHIIINRQGQIEYFLTGGSETRHEQLRPLIDNLLR